LRLGGSHFLPHLGSTDVILTGLWNGSAFADDETERQSFDAWGERRAADTFVTYRTTESDPFRTSARDYDRGYTGHEQLDDSGLIHMNGRIYDPELGRMLSPDPYVQVPEYSQNFNRYSYVMNNPLNLTDPTGFSWLSKAFNSIGNWLKENWRTVVVIVVAVIVTILTWGVASSAYGVAYSTAASAGALATTAAAVGTAAGAAASGAIVGAVTGGLNAALHGGDIGDVLRGALDGAISGALTGACAGLGGWEGILARGVVGGAYNVAMGGKFQDGFISAAATAAVSPTPLNGGDGLIQAVSKTAIAGAIGGTASSLGGGKFSNGAWTSAFSFLIAPSNSRIGAFNGIANGLNGLMNAQSWGDAGRSTLQILGLPRDFFPFSGWVKAPTGGKLPPSLGKLLDGAGGDEDKLLGVNVGGLNGHKAWHGGTNAGIAYAIGPVGSVFQILGGVFHEVDIWSPEAARDEYKNQGGVNQFLDSTGDILANLYGMGVGYFSLSPDAGVHFAMRTANYIPGPTDPWKTGKPTYHQQASPNPVNAWGGYP
jgi:RHS repeat-associated protein